MVSSDVDVCSQIGVDTMKKGGNAVDAAIGSLHTLASLVTRWQGVDLVGVSSGRLLTDYLS